MKVARTVLVASLLPFLLQFETVSTQVVVPRTVYLMGTRATLTVRVPDRDVAVQQLERMVRSLEETEAELSTWRSDTDLGTLNHQTVGEGLVISPPLCRLWPELTFWHRETQGAFDPAVGSLVEAWGLRGTGRLPSPSELLAALSHSGWENLSFDGARCRVVRNVGVTVDAGAFGKGVGLRRLQREFGEFGSWLVDLGGQVAVSEASSADPWPVAIADPRHRDLAVHGVRLAEGSLATSGGSERSQFVGGRAVGHILDPRNGRPVDWAGSVTVWHQDPFVADALSTALYVMGPEMGPCYAEIRDLAALFLEPLSVTEDSKLSTRATTGFRSQFPTVGEVVVPNCP